jgi:uncharacterized membrane protein YcaP (DUF421 family)
MRAATEAFCTVPRRCACHRGSILCSSQLAPSRQVEYMTMLETVAIVLLILWGLGLVSSYTMGGFIHVLLVVALVLIVVRFIQRRT